MKDTNQGGKMEELPSRRTEEGKTPQSCKSVNKGLEIHTDFHENMVPGGQRWEACTTGFLARVLLKIWTLRL